MLYHLPVWHITFYQMNIQRKACSFLCLEEMQYYRLNKLLQPQVQYMGNDENILLMQALKNIYEVVAQNLKIVRTKIMDNVSLVPAKLKEDYLVLIKGPYC